MQLTRSKSQFLNVNNLQPDISRPNHRSIGQEYTIGLSELLFRQKSKSLRCMFHRIPKLTTEVFRAGETLVSASFLKTVFRSIKKFGFHW